MDVKLRGHYSGENAQGITHISAFRATAVHAGRNLRDEVFVGQVTRAGDSMGRDRREVDASKAVRQVRPLEREDGLRAVRVRQEVGPELL